MSDDVDDIEAEGMTVAEIVAICEMVAAVIGMDEVLRVLDRHVYGDKVH